MNKVHAIIYGILILYIIFLKECKVAKPCPEIDDSGYTVKDSTVLRYKDTVYIKDERKYGHNVDIEEPVTVVPTDSGITREYFTTYEDTNIRGQIYTKVDGTLVDAGFYYTFKIPKQVIIHDSVRVETTTTIIQRKNRLLIGGRLGGNSTQFNAALGLGIKTKFDNVYLFDYDFVNKSYNASIYIPIQFSRNK